MHNPTAFILNTNENRTEKIRSLLTEYHGLPLSFRVCVQKDLDKFLYSREGPRHLNLCFLPYDKLGKYVEVQRRILEKYPSTQFIIDGCLGNQFALDLQNGSMQVSREPANSRESLHKILENLKDEHKITQPINLAFVGAGHFTSSTLYEFMAVHGWGKPLSWVGNVYLFSASAAEVSGKKGNFSYDHIINVNDLRDIHRRGLLKTFNDLNSWVMAASKADIVIYASGRHMKKYTDKVRGNTREAEIFLDRSFRGGVTHFLETCRALKREKFNNMFQVVSNPNGIYLNLAHEILGCDPQKITSSTPDSFRATKYLQEWLERYRTYDAEIPKDTRVLDVLTVGEHHNPFPVIESGIVECRGEKKLLIEMHSRFTKLGERIRSDTASRAAKTMRDALEIGHNYKETPAFFAKTLQQLATFEKTNCFDSKYQFKDGYYLQAGPVEFNYYTGTYTPRPIHEVLSSVTLGRNLPEDVLKLIDPLMKNKLPDNAQRFLQGLNDQKRMLNSPLVKKLLSYY